MTKNCSNCGFAEKHGIGCDAPGGSCTGNGYPKWKPDNECESQPVKTLLDEYAKSAMEKLIEISAGASVPREELESVYSFIAEQSWGFAAAMMREKMRRDEMGNVKEVEK